VNYDVRWSERSVKYSDVCGETKTTFTIENLMRNACDVSFASPSAKHDYDCSSHWL